MGPPTSDHFEVRRLHPDARLPSRAHEADAGFDLHTIEAFELAPRQRALIPTGIAIALPPGTAGLVLPRSGLAASSGVSVLNAPGLVDAGYRGEIKVVLVNHGSADASFAVGERVAQLFITACWTGVAREVEGLPGGTDGRGDSGFGSTGR